MEHLRFAPGILRRLGEELNPNPDQGIIELVRNAYDADATTCRIELVDVDKPGGTIRIDDNGVGMGQSDLVNGWLILGKSGKQTERVTVAGRKVVGNKGLGRLAALRLGQIATVETKTAKASKRLRLRLDWHLFDNAKVVEEVPLQIEPLAEKTKATEPPSSSRSFARPYRTPKSGAWRAPLCSWPTRSVRKEASVRLSLRPPSRIWKSWSAAPTSTKPSSTSLHLLLPASRKHPSLTTKEKRFSRRITLKSAKPKERRGSGLRGTGRRF